MSWRPFHLQLLSHDDGSGCRWDLIRVGLTLHTTQAASQDPGYGWNCRPWTSEGGIFWDESCRDWGWQFNVIRTKPHRQTLLLTSLLWGVETCCQAPRLMGIYLTSDWTGQTWAHKSVCLLSDLICGLDSDFCDLEHWTILGKGLLEKSTI